MAIIIEGSNGKYETAPEGNHVAICYAIYDVGTHPGFEGKPTRKVRICWELSNELMSDGRPFTVSGLYTMSLNDRAILRGMLVTWRGRQFSDEEIKRFDLANLLDKPAMVSVIHDKDGDKIWANVSGVTPLPKGMPVPARVNPLVQFSIDDPIPEGTPPWIAKKINESLERKKPHPATVPPAGSAPSPQFVPVSADDPNSVPF